MTKTIPLKIPEGPVLVEFADDGEVLSVRLEWDCRDCRRMNWMTIPGACPDCNDTRDKHYDDNILSALSPATLQHLREARDNMKDELEEALKKETETSGYWFAWHVRTAEEENEVVDALIERVETAEADLAEAKHQLPDEMHDCTIVYKECEVGHGWLTATNWVDFECPTCRWKAAEADNGKLRKALLRYGRHRNECARQRAKARLVFDVECNCDWTDTKAALGTGGEESGG